MSTMDIGIWAERIPLLAVALLLVLKFRPGSGAREVGLVSLPHPGLAWLLTLGAIAGWLTNGSLIWLLLPLLAKLPPAELSLGPSLTPCQATLLLRLPLNTVNRCLQRIPLERQRLWFRPDPMRLHLREPLLETQNAPGYFAALADFINQRHGSKLNTQEQLLHFCIHYPDTAADALFLLPVDQPQTAPPGWSSNNLSGKPGKLVQLRHLLLLRRIT